MPSHACNPSTRRLRQNSKFKASLGYILRPHFKKEMRNGVGQDGVWNCVCRLVVEHMLVMYKVLWFTKIKSNKNKYKRWLGILITVYRVLCIVLFSPIFLKGQPSISGLKCRVDVIKELCQLNIMEKRKSESEGRGATSLPPGAASGLPLGSASRWLLIATIQFQVIWCIDFQPGLRR